MENQRPIDETLIPDSYVIEGDRVGFIKKTYGHLALALITFVVVEFLFLSTPFIRDLALWFTEGWRWFIMLGGFMFATNFAEKWSYSATSLSKQYAGLGLYIVAQAFIFVPLLYICMVAVDPTIIPKAALITGFLFSGLTATAFFTGKDFSFLKTGLMIGGFVALGLIAAGIMFGFDLGVFFSAGMVLFAGASILYQTSNIIHHYRPEQYVSAALGLFASFMLMLWYVISFLMKMSSND